jgi:hypothetical protein
MPSTVFLSSSRQILEQCLKQVTVISFHVLSNLSVTIIRLFDYVSYGIEKALLNRPKHEVFEKISMLLRNVLTPFQTTRRYNPLTVLPTATVLRTSNPAKQNM